MIQLKKATKIYQTEHGVKTIALNEIDLTIEKKGMVFIVGTSGSGKSTLLNILGGLDSLTQGSFFIQGENISKFPEEKLDSYRNTYVGFIFQEFNLLEQYNVYENIELAKELQDQKASKEEIKKLLDSLDLTSFENRKVNELSGGQKQRVAIARALIKHPKMILADEPTGNLDHASGTQVFEILKEISKHTLVLVVSHDMDFAKQYADRILTLEDGKIVKDSQKEVTVTKEELCLEKSKLPFLYAIKMAFTSFKYKPFQLFMTVFLTTISLIFMGVTLTFALFDSKDLIKRTMKENQEFTYSIQNSMISPSGSVQNLPLTEKDLKEIEKKGKQTPSPVYSLYDLGKPLSFVFGEKKEDLVYFSLEPTNLQFVDVKQDELLSPLLGSLPKQEKELVIHKYLADYMIQYGVLTSDGTYYFPKDYQDLIRSKKELALGSNKVVIVGILDDDDHLYQEIKTKNYFSSAELKSDFEKNFVQKGNLVYGKGFVDSVNLREDKTSLLSFANLSIQTQDSLGTKTEVFPNTLKTMDHSLTVFTEDGPKTISSIPKNGLLLSLNTLKKMDRQWDAKFMDYLSQNPTLPYITGLQNFLQQYLKEWTQKDKIMLNFQTEDYEGSSEQLTILGVHNEAYDYISGVFFDFYHPKKKEMSMVFLSGKEEKMQEQVFSEFVFREDPEQKLLGTYYTYTIDHASEIASIINLYQKLMKYILILSLVFVLFTFLLFSNFISLSISHCKKEIGILRALGARKRDIIKIFSFEAMVLAICSWIFSVFGWYLVIHLLNQSIFANPFFILHGILPSGWIPMLLLVYTLLIAFFISGVSIKKITKIKPIEAILNKK